MTMAGFDSIRAALLGWPALLWLAWWLGERWQPHGVPRVSVYVAVGLAGSAIGLAVAALDGGAHEAPLTRIQNDLFDLGADIATPGDDFTPSQMTLRIVASQPTWLEGEIDRLNEALSPLTSFILPGGSEAAARVHVARASVRRAERAMTALAAEEPVNPAALAYINRLSDYLFVLARAVNAEQESRIGNQTGGRVFLFLQTDDFERDYSRMKARGIRFTEQSRRESFGTAVVFEDLYGNRWDLVQPADAPRE